MDSSEMPAVTGDPADRTPAMLSGRIAGLERDRAAAEAELVEVIERRRKLAAIDHGSDRAAAVQAQAQIAWLNERHRELMGHLDNLATEEAATGEQLGVVLERRQRGYADVCRPDVASLAKALIKQSQRIDDALAQLADALTSRAALARRIAGQGEVRLHLIENGTRLRAAVSHYGVQSYLDTAPSAPRLHAPLRDADEMLLRHLLTPPVRRAATNIEKEAVA